MYLRASSRNYELEVRSIAAAHFVMLKFTFLCCYYVRASNVTGYADFFSLVLGEAICGFLSAQTSAFPALSYS